MSRTRVSLFVLFLILGVAVQFGECENSNESNDNPNVDCDSEDEPGSKGTHMSPLEKLCKTFMNSVDSVGGAIGGAVDHIGDIFKKFKKNPTTTSTPQSASKGSFGDLLNKYADKIHIIYPGTLWCGSGDIAKHETDLGRFNDTDACCRAHDKCKNNIVVGKTEVNLKNDGLYTRSACACDHAFYQCLKDANSMISKGIAKTYFNILKPQCFRCACPADNCKLGDGTECKDCCKKYEWVNCKKF